MLDRIYDRRDEIIHIAKRNKAERLWVFGSCARKEDRADSDVDFLVQFAKGSTLFDMVGLQDGLKSLLGIEVDIVDSCSLDDTRTRIFASNVKRDMIAL